MSNKDCIERSMCHGPMDKNVRIPLLLCGICAVFFWIVGFVSCFQIVEAEKTGRSIKLDRLIAWLYTIGGSTGVLLGALAAGCLFIFVGSIFAIYQILRDNRK